MERKELLDQTKFNIRIKLYPLIKLMLEKHYREIYFGTEGSTKLVFNDREKAIQKISEEIERFAEERNESIGLVKDYLLNLLDSSKNEKPLFRQEYNEIESIICLNASQEERE